VIRNNQTKLIINIWAPQQTAQCGTPHNRAIEKGSNILMPLRPFPKTQGWRGAN